MTGAEVITDRDPGDETNELRCTEFFGGIWVRCELERHHEGKHSATLEDGIPFTWSRIRPGSSTVEELLDHPA